MSFSAQDAKVHIENLKGEIGDLLFHQATLERELELLTPEVESKIVKPTKVINLNSLTEKDLEVDLIPIKMANMDLVQKRKSFYYARQELASILIAIQTKKNMLKTYVDHMKQELLKQAKPVTDDMLYEKLKKVSELQNLSPEEQAIKDDIVKNAPTIMSSGKEQRMQLFETLQNFILQHG